MGTLLMRRMSEIGRARGLAGFTADVLATNKPMMTVFHKSGLEVRSELDGESYHLTMLFDERDTGEWPIPAPGAESAAAR
jgi:uncharacterized protein involved in propanediol utilization